MCRQARSMTPPFGSEFAAPLLPLFASLRATGASDFCHSGCGKVAVPRCEFCSGCCPDPSCALCDFHRLASEFACARQPGEIDANWKARLLAIKTAGIVDYAPFIRAITDGIRIDLAKPVPFTTFGLAAAIKQSWVSSSTFAPRLVVVGEFKQSSALASATTTLFMSAPLYSLPANLVASYNSCSAERIKRSKFLDRLTPVFSVVAPGESGTANAASGAQSERTFVVFGDDDARQAHCNNSPVRLFLHRVESEGQEVALLASCSCNASKEGLVERLLEKSLRSPAGK